MTTTETPVIAASVRAAIDVGRTLERIIERQSPVQLATLLVLEEVWHDAGITATRLAERVNLTPGTVTTVLGRMLRDGLLEKHADNADKRVWHYYLTDLGLNRLATARVKVGPLTSKLATLLMAWAHHPGADWADLLGQAEQVTP